jgi:2-polyprenyl-6-methoxyphenol hydroxylase-like FAD-dependent oxidoreductase
MSNKIIIVGADPIGLWTAIQLKLQRSDLEIIIHEKRSASPSALLAP